MSNEKYRYYVYLNCGRIISVDFEMYNLMKSIIENETENLKYITFENFNSDLNHIEKITIRAKDVSAVVKCIDKKELSNE